MAENEVKKPKRRLKPVQTVREKAQAEQNKTPPTEENESALKVFWRGFTWPLRMIGKGFRFIGRFVVPPYFRNSYKELRMVTWPTGKQSRQLTGAVIIFAVVFGLIIAGVDLGLDKVFKAILLRK